MGVSFYPYELDVILYGRTKAFEGPEAPFPEVTFMTGYMDDVLLNPVEVIDRSISELEVIDRDLGFDTLVGTGFSGAVIVPTLAMMMNKNFVLVRKEDDGSHHGGGRLLGTLGSRWIFVDDFVCSGETKRRVQKKIVDAAVAAPVATTYVGRYMYSDKCYRFQEPGPVDDEFIYECYANPTKKEI